MTFVARTAALSAKRLRKCSPSRTTPAQWKTASIVPNRSRAWATRAATSAWAVTSARRYTVSEPRARHRSTSASGTGPRPLSTSRAWYRRARCSATSAPIPPVAPVTRHAAPRVSGVPAGAPGASRRANRPPAWRRSVSSPPSRSSASTASPTSPAWSTPTARHRNHGVSAVTVCAKAAAAAAPGSSRLSMTRCTNRTRRSRRPPCSASAAATAAQVAKASRGSGGRPTTTDVRSSSPTSAPTTASRSGGTRTTRPRPANATAMSSWTATRRMVPTSARSDRLGAAVHVGRNT